MTLLSLAKMAIKAKNNHSKALEREIKANTPKPFKYCIRIKTPNSQELPSFIKIVKNVEYRFHTLSGMNLFLKSNKLKLTDKNVEAKEIYYV